MGRSNRILIVDDYAPFRHLVRSTLQRRPGLDVIGEASDGLGAVQKAQELQPDLILLDIELPALNGIEAARRIQKIAPGAKILFLSNNRSWNIAVETLRSGASGYVVKSDTAIELILAVDSVLQGKRFVSTSLSDHNLADTTGGHIGGHHEAGIYSDDRWLLEDATQFIGAALRAGNAVVVVATKPHRDILLPGLRAFGLDIGAVIEQGRYIALDAAETLSTFMVKGMPDPVRFMGAFGNLISRATEAAMGPHPRVGVFGECVDLLCTAGNVEAAIQIEKLGNHLVEEYQLDILCGYTVNQLQGVSDKHIYQRIRAEHSAVHFH